MKVKRQPRTKNKTLQKTPQEINYELQLKVEKLEEKIKALEAPPLLTDQLDIDLITSKMQTQHELALEKEKQKSLDQIDALSKKNSDLLKEINSLKTRPIGSSTQKDKEIRRLNKIIKEQSSTITSLHPSADISLAAIVKKRKESKNFDKILNAIESIFKKKKEKKFSLTWEDAELKYGISRSRISTVISKAIAFEIITKYKSKKTGQIKFKILRMDWLEREA